MRYKFDTSRFKVAEVGARIDRCYTELSDEGETRTKVIEEGVEVWYSNEDEHVHAVEKRCSFGVDLLACLQQVDAEGELPEALCARKG